MANLDLDGLDIAAIAAGVRAQEFSAVEVTQAHLARIETREPHVRCFITKTLEQALEQARSIDAQGAQGDDPGPLAGVPPAVKDI